MNIRKLILLVFTVCMAAFCYGGDTISYNIKDLIPIARDRQTTDILVPYRLDGKWGFVNQRLEKITDAVYDNILVVSKYCAYVKKDDNRIIVSADGAEKISVAGYPAVDCALLGDDCFAVPELIPGRDRERLKTTIFSVFDGEIAVIYDWKLDDGKYLEHILAAKFPLNCPGKNYINICGQPVFPQEVAEGKHWIRMYAYDPETKRSIVINREGRETIIDEKGNTVKVFWQTDSVFSDGLIAGITETERKLNNANAYSYTIPGGYYDRNGVKQIPVIFQCGQSPGREGGVDLFGMTAFNSGVLPCRIIDGEIHVMELYFSSYGKDWGIIDTDGNIIASHITANRITEFSEGVASIYTENKEGKEEVRLINTKGKIITKEAFDTIKECVNGYCVAQKDGEDYLISAKDGSVYRCRDFR